MVHVAKDMVLAVMGMGVVVLKDKSVVLNRACLRIK